MTEHEKKAREITDQIENLISVYAHPARRQAIEVAIAAALDEAMKALCQANAPIPGEASSREGALQTRPSPSSGWRPIESAPYNEDVLLMDCATAGAYAVACLARNTDGCLVWVTPENVQYNHGAFSHWAILPPYPTPSDTGLKSEQPASDDASPAAIGQPDTTGAPPAPED